MEVKQKRLLPQPTIFREILIRFQLHTKDKILESFSTNVHSLLLRWYAKRRNILPHLRTRHQSYRNCKVVSLSKLPTIANSHNGRNYLFNFEASWKIIPGRRQKPRWFRGATLVGLRFRRIRHCIWIWKIRKETQGSPFSFLNPSNMGVWKKPSIGSSNMSKKSKLALSYQ